jgi:hypothetical protein
MWGKVKIVAGLTNINKQMLQLLVTIGLCLVLQVARAQLYFLSLFGYGKAPDDTS